MEMWTRAHGMAAQTRTPARTQSIAPLRELKFLHEAGNVYSRPTEVCVQARRLSEPLRERSANTKNVILIKEGAKVKTSPSIVCLCVVSTGSPELAFCFSSLQKELSSSLSCSPSSAKDDKAKQRRSIEGCA